LRQRSTQKSDAQALQRRNAQLETRGMELDEIQRGMSRMRLVSAVQEEFALTPETAIAGLYVSTEPNLGLKRAPMLDAVLTSKHHIRGSAN
jgi:hypothetical protein